MESDVEKVYERVLASPGVVFLLGALNTGKSTFVNTLASADRMIVSEVAGTTRDSVDVRFELDGKAFIAIDTPGLKRSKSVKTDAELSAAELKTLSELYKQVVKSHTGKPFPQDPLGVRVEWNVQLPHDEAPPAQGATASRA